MMPTGMSTLGVQFTLYTQEIFLLKIVNSAWNNWFGLRLPL